MTVPSRSLMSPGAVIVGRCRERTGVSGCGCGRSKGEVRQAASAMFPLIKSGRAQGHWSLSEVLENTSV
jgi:hypothetical protein